MNERTPINRVIADAKADEWCKAQGGFSVFQLSNGTVDYFPTGNTPTVNGDVDAGATVLARFFWNHVRWSRIG